MFLSLSYPLTKDTPTSADIVLPLVVQPLERISAGDRSNLSRLSMTNHYGSHIDAPNHFNAAGKRLIDFAIGDFVFDHPLLLDLPKEDQGLVGAEDLERHRDAIAACDLLLLRTGFGRWRQADPERYRWRTPGVSGAAAAYIMAAFPRLRALGMDFISLEWTGDLSHQFQAHRTLLGDDAHPLMLMEDLRLAELPTSPRRVYAFPLLFEDLDSFPCTIVAELD